MMSPESIIYLDNAATTPLRREVLSTMLPYLQEAYGNPGGLYHLGRQAQMALYGAKQSISQNLDCQIEDIIFTASGTEANNLAIKGIANGLRKHGNHIITSLIEHDAVLNVCKYLEAQEGFEVTYLPVDSVGFISAEDLEKAITPKTILISLMHGNNEIGTLQNLTELGLVARRHGILFHTDAVQTVGKLPIHFNQLPIDLLSCSGHKLYGPKGSGFLLANETARKILVPLMQGGAQENNYRPSTENVAACVGLSKALELACKEMNDVLLHEKELQHQLINGILKIAPEAKLNGPIDLSKRVPGNVHFSFAPVEGETLVLRLDLNHVAVSSGSACHSSQLQGSHVILATGKTEEEAKSTLRFSIGKQNTKKEIDRVLDVLPQILTRCGYYKAHQVTEKITVKA